jgi:hypothetical protein
VGGGLATKAGPGAATTGVTGTSTGVEWTGTGARVDVLDTGPGFCRTIFADLHSAMSGGLSARRARINASTRGDVWNP